MHPYRYFKGVVDSCKMLVSNVTLEKIGEECGEGSLEGILYAVRHPISVLQEGLIRRRLEAILKESGYEPETKRAIWELSEEAALIHRGEYRETRYPVPILVPLDFDIDLRALGSTATIDLIFTPSRIFWWHPYEVAYRTIKHGGSSMAAASAVLHDTVESLQKTDPSRKKEELADYVSSMLGRRLRESGLESFVPYLPKIMLRVRALTKGILEGYPAYIRRIAIELKEPEDKKEGFAVKCFDACVNIGENRGHPHSEMLKGAFKNLLVANTAVHYLPRRRVGEKDSSEILLNNAWEDLIERTLYSLWNVTEGLRRFANKKTRRHDSEGMRLIEQFVEIEITAGAYRDVGGFSKVTKPSAKNQFHGTLERFVSYVVVPPKPMELGIMQIYQDAIGLYHCLTWMRGKRRPIAGLEAI